MTQKTKTHFEEVPVEVAQKIAEGQGAIQPTQATRIGQLRGPTEKTASRPASKVGLQHEREDS
jgi:hypothetical protein